MKKYYQKVKFHTTKNRAKVVVSDKRKKSLYILLD